MDETEKHRFFDHFIKHTDQVFYSYDVDAQSFTFLSDSFSQMWQRTQDSAFADANILLDTIHPDDQAYVVSEFDQLLKGVLKQNVECRILLPDNSKKWLVIQPWLIHEQGKRSIIGMVSDITREKGNFSNVEKFAAKKNSVLEILSHDLAAPLINIQGLTELLAETATNSESSEMAEIVQMIRKTCDRSIHLIRDLVQQEFLESSNADLFKRRIDVVKRTRQVMDQYQEGEQHVQKQFRFKASSEKIFAYIDDTKFMQVINNLISNSIKFTKDDGVISVELEELEKTLLITVRDNGIGIPKKYHNELFDKFTKARRHGLRGEPSVGLGMSIIRTIVEWHNGKIWFESEEDTGTTFYIEIPKA